MDTSAVRWSSFLAILLALQYTSFRSGLLSRGSFGAGSMVPFDELGIEVAVEVRLCSWAVSLDDRVLWQGPAAFRTSLCVWTVMCSISSSQFCGRR